MAAVRGRVASSLNFFAQHVTDVVNDSQLVMALPLMICPSFLYRMAVKSTVKSRDGPRLKWSSDDMLAAMEAVSSGKVQ